MNTPVASRDLRLRRAIAMGLNVRRKDDSNAPEEINDIKQVAAALERIRSEVKTAAEDAIKKHGNLSPELKKTVDELLTASTGLTARIAELEQKQARDPDVGAGRNIKTVGQCLIEDEKVKQFCKEVTAGARITVNLPKLALKAMFTEDLGAGVLEPQRLPGIQPRLRRRLFLRDIIASGTTGSNSIQFVQQTGFTNRADYVSEGKKKPESEINFEVKQVNVTTIAHLFKAAKQLLDDFAQLQSFVDSELRYGLKLKEETELLYGDGTGIHLLGIVPQATPFAPAFSVTNQTRIDDLRLAILQSELAELPADGIVLHPIAWASIELTKTTDGAYVFANPLGLASPNLWGKSVVPTQAMEQNEFLTGGFDSAAQIFDREQENIQIATQNNDDFEKNMITIRCEERLALVVKRPESFITGEFESEIPSA